MQKFLLTARERFFLMLLIGYGAYAGDCIVDHVVCAANQFTQLMLTTPLGVMLLILFLDMANYGYLAIKLKQYPLLGLRYEPGFVPMRQHTGRGAVLRGWIMMLLSFMLSCTALALLLWVLVQWTKMW